MMARFNRGHRSLLSGKRRFLIGVIAGVALVALGWALLLMGQLGRPTVSNLWISQAYDYKLALAEEIREPQLLVVAGSNALFGIDSALLERAVGRPVLNFGVNAGVQSSYVLAYARRAVRPGDWVLLPIEYPMFHDRHRVGYAFLDYLLSHPSYRSIDLSVAQLAQVFWLTPLSRVWEGYRGLPAGFEVAGLYGAHNMDERGDQIDTEAARQEQWMRDAVERSEVKPYGGLATDFHAGWSQWRRFADEVEAMGGCAVFVPSAMLDRPTYHQGREQAYYAGFGAEARSRGLRYVGEPFDFLYPMDHFFDTNFHLNAEARRMHTERVLDLVEPAFAECSK